MCLMFTSGFTLDKNGGLLNESPLLVLSVHRLIRNNYYSRLWAPPNNTSNYDSSQEAEVTEVYKDCTANSGISDIFSLNSRQYPQLKPCRVGPVCLQLAELMNFPFT